MGNKEFEVPVTINGVEYLIAFNMNVMAALQAKYGTVKKWVESLDADPDEPNAEALRDGFLELINEGIDIQNERDGGERKMLTPKQVGRLITAFGQKEVGQTIAKAMKSATKTAESEAENSKNE